MTKFWSAVAKKLTFASVDNLHTLIRFYDPE